MRYKELCRVDDQKKSSKPEENRSESSIHQHLRTVNLRLGIISFSAIREICGKGVVKKSSKPEKCNLGHRSWYLLKFVDLIA
jgi:hypothetical protein